MGEEGRVATRQGAGQEKATREEGRVEGKEEKSKVHTGRRGKEGKTGTATGR